ncbi:MULTISPECIES: hypothetical protein [Pseudomonas]|uniref:hypothetical protein n=1 Tax=Pseudomonas TaxID=286 RepID=UPI002953A92A|nr:hypothetical protein [Pseudomonas fragi]WOL27936.1 hypothetical protein Q1A94_23945 [Pseudomonas fragi]
MSLQKFFANLRLIKTLPSRVDFDDVAEPEYQAPVLQQDQGRLMAIFFQQF